jgi:hypothetical protein
MCATPGLSRFQQHCPDSPAPLLSFHEQRVYQEPDPAVLSDELPAGIVMRKLQASRQPAHEAAVHLSDEAKRPIIGHPELVVGQLG